MTCADKRPKQPAPEEEPGKSYFTRDPCNMKPIFYKRFFPHPSKSTKELSVLLYGYETRAINQTARKNANHFQKASAFS
ncbi:MAG: hypothetical protein FWD72_01240 [Eggerthellaceae bacterium]|nr:hypothetical protein [Eggerthellaceae bacterium]